MKLSQRLLTPLYVIVLGFLVHAFYLIFLGIPRLNDLQNRIEEQQQIYSRLLQLRDYRSSTQKDLLILQTQSNQGLRQHLNAMLDLTRKESNALLNLKLQDTELENHLKQYVNLEVLLNEKRWDLFRSISSSQSWLHYNSSMLLDSITDAKSTDIVRYLELSIRRTYQESDRHYRWMLRLSGIFIFVAASMIALKGIYINRYILEPLYSLLSGMKDITAGTYRKLEPSSAVDEEIKGLIVSYNRMEEALRESKEQAEFFNTIAAHDLREPLTTILSYINFLDHQKNVDPAEYPMITQRIRRNAEIGLELVTNLLELARSSHTNLKREAMDLNEVAEEIIETLELKIIRSGARVKVAELKSDFWGDRTQLETLFRNIIGNAIKYQDGDRPLVISVYTQVHGQFLKIHFEDTGKGFDESKFAQLLQPFQGGSETREKLNTDKGFGMGLTVCQRICRNHGGDLTATSRPGVGSHFVAALLIDSSGVE